MAQAVKSVSLVITFDIVASFQPTGDLDDGALIRKQNSFFQIVKSEFNGTALHSSRNIAYLLRLRTLIVRLVL